MIDNLSHMYTLIIRPDNTFEYRIDGVQEANGKLEEGWNFLAPRTIPDPTDKKPADWDDEPAEIPDPSATKPEDWDDEDDGEWEAPMIPKWRWNKDNDSEDEYVIIHKTITDCFY